VKATTNRAWMASAAPAAEPAGADRYLRFAQSNFLTELLGVAFGIVTLAYIVSSLLALA